MKIVLFNLTVIFYPMTIRLNSLSVTILLFVSACFLLLLIKILFTICLPVHVVVTVRIHAYRQRFFSVYKERIRFYYTFHNRSTNVGF